MRKLSICLLLLATILAGCKKSEQEDFSISQLKWKAANNGIPTTYNFLMNGQPTNVINSLAIQGNNIYAGTNGDGIYLSNDNGNNWTFLKNSPSYVFNQVNYKHIINTITVQENNVYAGTTDGIYLSSDTGKTWVGVNNGLSTNLQVFSIAIQQNNIYAGTYNGVYVSSNNGSSWTAVNNGLPINNHQVYSIAILGNNIYAGTNGGIYLSTNNGNSWIAMNNGLPTNTYCARSLTIQGNNIYAVIDIIYRFPDGSGLITNGGIYLSTNNGNSWTAVNNGLPTYLYKQANYNCSISAIAIQGNNIYAGTSNGIYLSRDNGNNWTAINNGLPYTPSVTEVLSIAVQGNNIYAGMRFHANAPFSSNDSGLFLLQNAVQ
jgi:photosystem II stability/assembly factor-like uncharacterized protein